MEEKPNDRKLEKKESGKKSVPKKSNSKSIDKGKIEVSFWRIVLFTVIFLFILFALVPLLINHLYIQNTGYITVWSGADVLAFYGSALGAVGTIVLGAVAWNQNRRLLKMEEHSFLASNTSKLIISNIYLSDFDKVATNFEEHTEQVVAVDEENYHNHTTNQSISLTFKMQAFEHYPYLLFFERVIIAISNKENEIELLLDAKNISNEYSLVGMTADSCVFNCTDIIPVDKKTILKEKIEKEQCAMVISVELKTITDKYVCTRWRVKAKLYNSEEEKCTFQLGNAVPAMCFWLGSEMVDKRSIKTRRIEEPF